MTTDAHSPKGRLTDLVDEQLELAAAKLPALAPGLVHPSPVDHQERQDAHPDIEDVLLGTAVVSPELLAELTAQGTAPELSDEELARQALADGGADNDPSTPE